MAVFTLSWANLIKNICTERLVNFRIITRGVSIQHPFRNSACLHKKVKPCLNTALLKDNLRSYVQEHSYCLAAVEAHGNSIEKENIVSEPFSETTYWIFEMYNPKPEIKHRTTVLGLNSTDLFARGYEALERYVKGEEMHQSHLPAIKALERFFFSKGEHEESLLKLRDKYLSNTNFGAILTQHFLSQLLPHPSNYFLDKYNNNPDDCPCSCVECGVPINSGLTQVGSPNLFYGSFDIVLIPTNRELYLDHDYHSTSAVFSFPPEKSERELFEYCNNEVNGRELNDDFDEDINDFLDREKTVRQLCKQAISMSLCKLNETFQESGKQDQNGNSDAVVPVCGITRDSYDIAMYDANNDYLLKTIDPLHLFERIQHSPRCSSAQYSLKFSAIVDLWLLIHHHLFCTVPRQNDLKYLKGTCNLVPQLGDKRFETIVRNSNWLYFPEFGINHFKFRKQDIMILTPKNLRHENQAQHMKTN